MSDRSAPARPSDAETEFMKALNDGLSTELPPPPRRGQTTQAQPDAPVAPKTPASDARPAVKQAQNPAQNTKDLRVPPVTPVEVSPLPPLFNVGRSGPRPYIPTENAPLDLTPQWMKPQAAPEVAPKPAPPAGQATTDVKPPVAPVAPPPLPDLVLNDDLPEGYGDSYTPSAVIVDKTHHLTHVLQMHNGELEDVLTIPNAVGADNMSPNERMVVAYMEWDHAWTPPTSIDPNQTKIPPWSQSNGRNPLGEGYISLQRSYGLPDDGSFGLHGTNDPSSIGKSVSHGCVRHQNADLERLWPLVHKGTPVYFVDDIHGAQLYSKDFQPKR